jgi:aryl-alcohol dehydrogenase-like predicted oxidoreductase
MAKPGNAIPSREELRRLGTSNLLVSPVAMGCWPIAGITSVGVSEGESLRTLQAALDTGINFFDTAYCYGYDGESERMIARALGHRRDEIVIASKCGIHWGPDLMQQKDARPETIRRQCDESLQRLGTDHIDLYYLHAPDPDTPLDESAGALDELRRSGKVRAVGVSNFQDVAMYEQFHAVCPITAAQPHYNMLQREIEADRLPWCIEHHVAVVVYWPLMKGFLAGKLRRDHQWDPRDGRQKYSIFQNEQWAKTHDFVDALRGIAGDVGCTVAQLVVAWTIQRPGITAALCGAKRPDQIRETAAAMTVRLSDDVLAAIDRAIAERGEVISRPAVS